MAQYDSIETPQDYVNYTFNVGAKGTAHVAGELAGLSNTVATVLGDIAFKTSEFLAHTEIMAIGVGVAVSAAFTSATKDAIRFQQQVANVKAIGGESVDAQLIGDKAMEFSNKFGMATSSMTEGLEALARAGITTTEVMAGVLEEGVKLSKLEGIDLEESINDLIATTNLLSVENVDMNDPQYAEMLKQMNQHIVSTSESAPINAHNIIQTLQHVGGYASAGKMDQDDLFAVIAQLGSRGTKGEMAGTALRAFIAAGQKDTAQRALARIGLDVSDLWTNDGEVMLSISEMKDVLDTALDARGFSKQEKLEFYSDFAGYKQANQIMKIDTTEVQKYKETIAHAWDLGTKLNTILGTVQGNLDRIKQTGINFMTKVGGKLLPIFNAVLAPIRMGLELWDKIPFSHTITAAGMMYIGLKTIFAIINKIVPAVGGMFSSFDNGQEKVRGIRGEFHHLAKEIEMSKETLGAVFSLDKDELRRQHSERRGPSAKSKEEARMHIGGVLWEQTRHYQGHDVPWNKVDIFQREDWLQRVEGTQQFKDALEKYEKNIKKKNKEAIQFIGNIDEEESYEYGDSLNRISNYTKYIYDLLKDDDAPDDNRKRNQKERESEGNSNFTFPECIRICPDSINLLAALIAGAIKDNDEPIYKTSNNGASGSSTSSGSRSSSSNEDVVVIKIEEDDTEIPSTSDVNKEVISIKNKVRPFYYGDYSFDERYKTEEQLNKAHTKALKDLQRKINNFSNIDVNNINTEQRARLKKSLIRQPNNFSSDFAERANSSDIKRSVSAGVYREPTHKRVGIRDAQIKKMAEMLNIEDEIGPIDNISGPDKRASQLKAIHQAFINQNKITMDDILAETSKIWNDQEASKSIPRYIPTRVLANNLDMSKEIAQALSISQHGNVARNIQTYMINMATEDDIDTAINIMFKHMKTNEKILADIEAEEIKYVMENIARIENTYDALGITLKDRYFKDKRAGPEYTKTNSKTRILEQRRAELIQAIEEGLIDPSEVADEYIREKYKDWIKTTTPDNTFDNLLAQTEQLKQDVTSAKAQVQTKEDAQKLSQVGQLIGGDLQKEIYNTLKLIVFDYENIWLPDMEEYISIPLHSAGPQYIKKGNKKVPDRKFMQKIKFSQNKEDTTGIPGIRNILNSNLMQTASWSDKIVLGDKVMDIENYTLKNPFKPDAKTGGKKTWGVVNTDTGLTCINRADGGTCILGNDCYAFMGARTPAGLLSQLAKMSYFYHTPIDQITKDMNALGLDTIRVNQEGDFNNVNEDFLKMIQLAEDNPEKRFYAYSKNLDVLKYVEDNGLPENFTMNNSLGTWEKQNYVAGHLVEIGHYLREGYQWCLGVCTACEQCLNDMNQLADITDSDTFNKITLHRKAGQKLLSNKDKATINKMTPDERTLFFSYIETLLTTGAFTEKDAIEDAMGQYRLFKEAGKDAGEMIAQGFVMDGLGRHSPGYMAKGMADEMEDVKSAFVNGINNIPMGVIDDLADKLEAGLIDISDITPQYIAQNYSNWIKTTTPMNVNINEFDKVAKNVPLTDMDKKMVDIFDFNQLPDLKQNDDFEEAAINVINALQQQNLDSGIRANYYSDNVLSLLTYLYLRQQDYFYSFKEVDELVKDMEFLKYTPASIKIPNSGFGVRMTESPKKYTIENLNKNFYDRVRNANFQKEKEKYFKNINPDIKHKNIELLTSAFQYGAKIGLDNKIMEQEAIKTLKGQGLSTQEAKFYIDEVDNLFKEKYKPQHILVSAQDISKLPSSIPYSIDTSAASIIGTYDAVEAYNKIIKGQSLSPYARVFHIDADNIVKSDLLKDEQKQYFFTYNQMRKKFKNKEIDKNNFQWFNSFKNFLHKNSDNDIIRVTGSKLSEDIRKINPELGIFGDYDIFFDKGKIKGRSGKDFLFIPTHAKSYLLSMKHFIEQMDVTPGERYDNVVAAPINAWKKGEHFKSQKPSTENIEDNVENIKNQIMPLIYGLDNFTLNEVNGQLLNKVYSQMFQWKDFDELFTYSHDKATQADHLEFFWNRIGSEFTNGIKDRREFVISSMLDVMGWDDLSNDEQNVLNNMIDSMIDQNGNLSELIKKEQKYKEELEEHDALYEELQEQIREDAELIKEFVGYDSKDFNTPDGFKYDKKLQQDINDLDDINHKMMYDNFIMDDGLPGWFLSEAEQDKILNQLHEEEKRNQEIASKILNIKKEKVEESNATEQKLHQLLGSMSLSREAAEDLYAILQNIYPQLDKELLKDLFIPLDDNTYKRMYDKNFDTITKRYETANKEHNYSAGMKDPLVLLKFLEDKSVTIEEIKKSFDENDKYYGLYGNFTGSFIQSLLENNILTEEDISSDYFFSKKFNLSGTLQEQLQKTQSLSVWKANENKILDGVYQQWASENELKFLSEPFLPVLSDYFDWSFYDNLNEWDKHRPNAVAEAYKKDRFKDRTGVGGLGYGSLDKNMEKFFNDLSNAENDARYEHDKYKFRGNITPIGILRGQAGLNLDNNYKDITTVKGRVSQYGIYIDNLNSRQDEIKAIVNLQNAQAVEFAYKWNKVTKKQLQQWLKLNDNLAYTMEDVERWEIEKLIDKSYTPSTLRGRLYSIQQLSYIREGYQKIKEQGLPSEYIPFDNHIIRNFPVAHFVQSLNNKKNTWFNSWFNTDSDEFKRDYPRAALRGSPKAIPGQTSLDDFVTTQAETQTKAPNGAKTKPLPWGMPGLHPDTFGGLNPWSEIEKETQKIRERIFDVVLNRRHVTVGLMQFFEDNLDNDDYTSTWDLATKTYKNKKTEEDTTQTHNVPFVMTQQIRDFINNQKTSSNTAADQSRIKREKENQYNIRWLFNSLVLTRGQRGVIQKLLMKGDNQAIVQEIKRSNAQVSNSDAKLVADHLMNNPKDLDLIRTDLFKTFQTDEDLRRNRNAHIPIIDEDSPIFSSLFDSHYMYNETAAEQAARSSRNRRRRRNERRNDERARDERREERRNREENIDWRRLKWNDNYYQEVMARATTTNIQKFFADTLRGGSVNKAMLRYGYHDVNSVREAFMNEFATIHPQAMSFDLLFTGVWGKINDEFIKETKRHKDAQQGFENNIAASFNMFDDIIDSTRFKRDVDELNKTWEKMGQRINIVTGYLTFFMQPLQHLAEIFPLLSPIVTPIMALIDKASQIGNFVKGIEHTMGVMQILKQNISQVTAKEAGMEEQWKDAQIIKSLFGNGPAAQELYKALGNITEEITKYIGIGQEFIIKQMLSLVNFITSNILILGPLMAGVAVTVGALWLSEKNHAKALQETQEKIEEYDKKVLGSLATYKDLNKQRENETNAIKRQQIAIREATALYQLEANGLQKLVSIDKRSQLKADNMWGEYGARAGWQRFTHGHNLISGEFESQYANYDSTTKNIRQIREEVVGNLFATSAQKEVAAFYDRNIILFGEVEAYSKELGELYDKETKLIEEYGSIEAARETEEFNKAVQDFADATRLNGETAVQMLNWLETENRVDKATQVMQLHANMIVAEAQRNAYAELYPNRDFSDTRGIEDAMIYAQADQIMKDAYDRLWWEAFGNKLWGYFNIIIGILNPADWVGEILGWEDNRMDIANRHLKASESYDDGLKKLVESQDEMVKLGKETAENADRRNYGTKPLSSYGDTPFGFSVENAIKTEEEAIEKHIYMIRNTLYSGMEDAGQQGVSGFKDGLNQHSPGDISNSVLDEMLYSQVFIDELTPILSDSFMELGQEEVLQHNQGLGKNGDAPGLIPLHTQQELEYAKNILEDNQEPIGQVSYDVGYESGQQYGNGFKDGLNDLYAQISTPEALEETLKKTFLYDTGLKTAPNTQSASNDERTETVIESVADASGFILPEIVEKLGSKIIRKGATTLGKKGIAKGLEGLGEATGKTGLKTAGKTFGKVAPFIGPFVTAGFAIAEHNPFEKHYNEDGSEKRAFQSSGEVAGEVAGSIAAMGIGLAVGGALETASLGALTPFIPAIVAGVDIVAGMILEPIGKAIGGTIGWMVDEIVNTPIKDMWGQFNDALGGIPGQIYEFVDQSIVGQAGHWVFNQLDNATGGWLSSTWDYVSNSSIAGMAGDAWNGLTGALGGVWNWLFGGEEENKSLYDTYDMEQLNSTPYNKVDNLGNVGKKVKNISNDNTKNTIIIKNININTEDDPEKIKTAFMNLMIELEEQISPRQVSRVIGEPNSASTDATTGTDATNPNADPNNPNSNTNTNNSNDTTTTNVNTNNNPTP